MSRLILMVACAGILAAAQESRIEKLTVDGPRPLAKAAEVLEQRYGWAINYEDPPWDYSGDVEDHTTAERRAGKPDLEHRLLVPRSGHIDLEYAVDSATGRPRDALTVLQSLVAAHAAGGNPGVFRVIQEGGYFLIVPAGVRDTQGRWGQALRILETPVSFPAEQRSIGAALAVLQEQIRQRTGRKLWPAGVGANFMALGHTLAGASEEPAWVALRRIVDEPAYGPSGSTVARRTVWHLYYQPGFDWALNLHPAPGPVSTAAAAPPPPVYRLETPAKWFDRTETPAPEAPQPAQSKAIPRFTRDGANRSLLSPGMIIELYGENFGPSPWCGMAIPQNGPYPPEACGVRVTVGGNPAGLLYVGEKQINLKIPDTAPEEGSVPVQVCVREICSQPVEFRFSTHKAYVRVQGRARVHMPVWIEAEQPWPYGIAYPTIVWPWDFGGHSFEVYRNGELMAPVRPQGQTGGMISGRSVAPSDSPRSRLPLHLFYRFDQPGTYSVRLTRWRYGPDHRTPEIACQSDWTEFVVEPFSASERDAWLQDQAIEARSAKPGKLIGDIIPSLLAWPGEKALAILLPLLEHADDLVRQFARQSLTAFDADLLRRVIPPDRFPALQPSRIRI